MRLLLAVALLLTGALPESGWGQGWVADISAGGVSHETVAAEVGSRSAILGIRYDGPRWLYLSLGAPLDSVGLPWAAAGAGRRIEAERGTFTLGADLTGHLHAYRQRHLDATGAGAILEALPFVGLARGPVGLELHAGFRSYSGTFGDSTFSRAVVEGGARLGLEGDAGLTLSAETRVVRAEEGSFPYLGAQAAWNGERGSAWAMLGRWFSQDIAGAAPVLWGGGASVPLARRFQAELSLQQEARDPLYWNFPRRLWSVGVSRSLGASGAALPAVPVLSETRNGRVAIRLPAAEAGPAPAVAGDFTGWEPVRMTRSGNEWVASFPLASGVYRYAFRRADGKWFVPESVPERVDDGFGGVNAVLIVP